jgi:hypothetical protein
MIWSEGRWLGGAVTPAAVVIAPEASALITSLRDPLRSLCENPLRMLAGNIG